MKKQCCIILCILALFSCARNLAAENPVFVGFLEKISVLEAELKLFDAEITRAAYTSPSRYRYFSRVVSIGGRDTITCMLYVSPSILKIALPERKKRLAELCSNLFEDYQNKFWMTETESRKIPGEIGMPLMRMKSCNVDMYIYTEYPQPRLLSTWGCGIMKYKKDFLK